MEDILHSVLTEISPGQLQQSSRIGGIYNIDGKKDDPYIEISRSGGDLYFAARLVSRRPGVFLRQTPAHKPRSFD